jgi:PHD/YefM family antitoxin component YafN of YafNO toxin-antitoxin module
MQAYTYSEARQKVATVLEKADSNSFIINPTDG